MPKYLLRLQKFPGLASVSDENAATLNLPQWFNSIEEMEAFGKENGIDGFNLASRTYAVPDGEEPDETKHRLIGQFCLVWADPYYEGDYER